MTVFEAIGAYRAGKISLDELYEVENAACPGAGACGGQFTANTMSMVLEFIGLSPAGLNGIPAEDPAKDDAARRTGELVMDLVRRDVRPSSIVTRASLENAIASVAATGGSTNGVLHLLAIAHEFGIPLDIDEFGAIADRTPIVADMQPGGRYTRLGPVRRGRRRAWSCASCSSGRAAPRRRADRRRPDDRRDRRRRRRDARPEGRRADRAPAQADRRPGDPPRLLAPDGCVVKLAGHERRLHRGPARVFDSETACYDAVRGPADRSPATSSSSATRARSADPGCRRCCSVTGALVGEGLGDIGRAAHRRPLLGRDPRADDRPRRARGGARRPDRARPARATRSSSTSTARPSTWRSRPTSSSAALADWTPPAPRYRGGVMAKYAALVGSASEGAVTTGPRMTRATSAADDRRRR